jgi:hypothetical protein
VSKRATPSERLRAEVDEVFAGSADPGAGVLAEDLPLLSCAPPVGKGRGRWPSPWEG